MDWPTILIVAVAVIAFLLIKRIGMVGAEAAQNWLKQGAILIDVRRPSEFAAGHLSGAINIPVGELRGRMEKQVPDKNGVVLLHCMSGARSGMARRILKQMGYAQAYNLGSYGRAARIVRDSGR